MTIQSNVSNQSEVIRQISWPLALFILGLGVLLGILGSNIAAVANGTGVAAAIPGQTSQAVPVRAQVADAARYSSQGLFYAAGNGQPAISAETARYEGLADYYGIDRQPISAETARYEGLADYYRTDREPALAAETDRYEGLTEYYGAAADSHSLAWPPRPNQFFLEKNGVETDPNADIGLME